MDKNPSPIEKLGQPPESRVKKVIAIASGKGGVGKSSVAAMLAVALRKQGKNVGILDADITGPSIPRLFGVRGIPGAVDDYVLPQSTRTGIKVMSLNLLLESEDQPVIWRGPLIAGAIKQFWTDVIWGDLDYLIVDLPPGTGDAPLTVLQSLPVDGVVLVSTPQELALMVVRKARAMVEMLKVPIAGVILNMAYFVCPNCGEKVDLFGAAGPIQVAAELGTKVLGALPLDPELVRKGDAGEIEDYPCDEVLRIVRVLEQQIR